MKSVNELMSKVETLAEEIFLLMECFRCDIFASKYFSLNLGARYSNTHFFNRECSNVISQIYNYLDIAQDHMSVIRYLKRTVLRLEKISDSFLDFKDLITKAPTDFPKEYFIISREFFDEECHTVILKRLYCKKNIIDDLINDISKLVEITVNEQKNASSNKTVLGIVDSAEYLGISKSALYKLTSKRVIPFFKPSGKLIYFNRVDLDKWMLQNRVNSASDSNSYSINYLAQKK
jgi:excisionase family DNA binding protein